jgi:hypothetical protein
MEGYRGITGAKNACLPQKCPENPPKVTPEGAIVRPLGVPCAKKEEEQINLVLFVT